jgi:transcriptional regulator with XRE-family HTH domain
MHAGKGEPRRARLGSLGYHLRKRRLSLGLLQQDIAPQLGVQKTTIHNWENGIGEPQLECVPKIIEFLGHNPLSGEGGIGSRLRVSRKALGLSQKALAAQLAVDPGTLAKWERGDRVPSGAIAERVAEFFLSPALDGLTTDSVMI